MNLTSTLKRIEAFLGASDQSNIQLAAQELTRICYNLLQKALPRHGVVPRDLKCMMSQNIDEAITNFLQTPTMTSMPRTDQANVFQQVVKPFQTTYNELYDLDDNSDWGNYQRRTYDTLCSALQSKYVELQRQ